MSPKYKLFSTAIALLVFPMKIFMKIFPKKMPVLLHELCKRLQLENYYLEYRIMPKRASDIPLYKYSDESLKNLAIILQGPLRVKDNYTVDTVKYYKELYPEATVIVSTWKNQNQQIISELKSCGAVVIESEDLKNPGIVNTNRQKYTTLQGIRKAKELGLKYAAKTRTDQCLRRPHVFQFMLSLLKTYPILNRGGGISKRKNYCFTDYMLRRCLFPLYSWRLFLYGKCR